jgi:hypothetical protein
MKTIIAKLKFMLRNLSLASTRAGASFVSSLIDILKTFK